MRWSQKQQLLKRLRLLAELSEYKEVTAATPQNFSSSQKSFSLWLHHVGHLDFDCLGLITTEVLLQLKSPHLGWHLPALNSECSQYKQKYNIFFPPSGKSSKTHFPPLQRTGGKNSFQLERAETGGTSILCPNGVVRLWVRQLSSLLILP